jgi:CHAD domain-containing protein
VKTRTDKGTAKNAPAGPLLNVPRHLPADESPPSHEAWGRAKLYKIARHQIDKFISLVPEILRYGNLQSISKMRVTARRLEQILDLLYHKPRPRRIKKLHRQLKACRRTLGNLRNYDALLVMVNQFLALKTVANIRVLKALRDYLQDRRSQEAQKTLERLGRINLTASYLKLRRDLDSETLFQPLLENDPMVYSETNGGSDLNDRIMKSLDQRWNDFERAVENSRRNPHEEGIHHMRIAAKRFRYLTEAMEKLHIERSSETLAWLRTLQDTVGRWHDRQLLEHAISEMLTQPRFREGHPGLNAEVRRLIHHNREVKEQLERKFFWMTSHSLHYHGARDWVVQLLANGNGNGTSKAQLDRTKTAKARGPLNAS